MGALLLVHEASQPWQGGTKRVVSIGLECSGLDAGSAVGGAEYRAE